MSYWLRLTVIFLMLCLVFLLVGNSCEVTEYNTYKSAEDCVLKKMAQMVEAGTVLDVQSFELLKERCSQYDR